MRSDDFVDPSEVDYIRKIMATAKAEDLSTLSASVVRSPSGAAGFGHALQGARRQTWTLSGYVARKVDIDHSYDKDEELVPDYQVRHPTGCRDAHLRWCQAGRT